MAKRNSAEFSLIRAKILLRAECAFFEGAGMTHEFSMQSVFFGAVSHQVGAIGPGAASWRRVNTTDTFECGWEVLTPDPRGMEN